MSGKMSDAMIDSVLIDAIGGMRGESNCDEPCRRKTAAGKRLAVSSDQKLFKQWMPAIMDKLTSPTNTHNHGHWDFDHLHANPLM